MMNFKKYKPTFLSVVSIIGIIIGIPLGFYGMTLTGGASLIGVVIFAVVIGLFILLVLDRVLVSIFDPKKLSIIELGIFIILLTIFLIRID
jgi:hypothetical protein